MGWKGAAIGGYLGGVFGLGLPGAILGAVLGHNVEKRLSRNDAGRRQRTADGGRARSVPEPLAAAYATIGASPSDGTETLKRKYRELAKRNHPDALRARGASEFEIGQATLRMVGINEAWAKVRAARGI